MARKEVIDAKLLLVNVGKAKRQKEHKISPKLGRANKCHKNSHPPHLTLLHPYSWQHQLMLLTKLLQNLPAFFAQLSLSFESEILLLIRLTMLIFMLIQGLAVRRQCTSSEKY